MHMKRTRQSQNLRQSQNYNYKLLIMIIICGAQDYQNLERLLPSILPQLHLLAVSDFWVSGENLVCKI